MAKSVSQRFLRAQYAIPTTIGLILGGCTPTIEDQNDALKPEVADSITQKAMKSSKNRINRQEVEEGIKAFLAADYAKASRQFNQALFEDPKNYVLHYLNGVSYEFLARNGGIRDGLELADAAYTQAIKFKPDFFEAVRQLARINYLLKHYDKAQEFYAQASLLHPNDHNLLMELANASYYSYDLPFAYGAIQKALTKAPKAAGIQRSAALICAALNKNDEAQEHLKLYTNLEKDREQIAYIRERVASWKESHLQAREHAQNIPSITATQLPADPNTNSPSSMDPTQQPADSNVINNLTSSSLPNTDPSQMVVIDVIILRQSQEGSTSKGQNLLSSSGTSGQTGAWDNPFTITLAGNSGTNASPSLNKIWPGLNAQRVFSGLSFSSIQYSLNIANATENRTEIVSRPSMTTMLGKQAKFFSGDNIATPITGQFGGNIAETQFGITMDVTPLSIKGNKVLLDVQLEGKALAAPLAQFGTTTNNFLHTSHSSIDTKLELEFDETALVAGITARVDSGTKDGFPLLQDIPFIQYFTSQATTESQRTNTAYMITVRRPESQKALTNAYNTFRAKHSKNREAIITAFEQRNRDWFHASPNMPGIYEHLSDVYYEFRTGDMAPVRWEMPDAVFEMDDTIFKYLWY